MTSPSDPGRLDTREPTGSAPGPAEPLLPKSQSPVSPDDIPWREPEELHLRPGDRRLSDVGDRRLTDVRANEPRLGGAWLKILLMMLFLAAILIFHSEASNRAAGCYQEAAGLKSDAPKAAPTGPSRAQSGNEVQFRIERVPATTPAPPQ